MVVDPPFMEQVLIDALSVLPDGVLSISEHWVQVRTPSSEFANHNKIVRARLAEADVARRIADVIADHTARGSAFDWIVGPGSSPASLSEHLRAAGVPLAGRLEGMVLPAHQPQPLPNDDIEFQTVTRANLQIFANVSALAWENPVYGEVSAYWARRYLESRDTSVRFWIGFLRGDPVAACTLRLLPYAGYLQGAAVIPSARGEGLYRAMTSLRLGVVANEGHEHALLWANPETSGPIATRMGFRSICSAVLHRFQPGDRA